MGIFEDRPELKAVFCGEMRRQGWPTNRAASRQLKEVDYRINERAAIRRRIDAVQKDGYVSFVRSGMDCDCTQYYHSTRMPVPVSIFRWQRDDEDRRGWLDGPESSWFEEPGENVHKQADRALEAYENGHPHRVEWGDL